MAKKKKTREEKIRSAYRLQNFKLDAEKVQARRDIEEFGYLSKDYVRQDLTKTIVFSLVIVALLFLAKKYLG